MISQEYECIFDGHRFVHNHDGPIETLPEEIPCETPGCHCGAVVGFHQLTHKDCEYNNHHCPSCHELKFCTEEACGYSYNFRCGMPANPVR